MTRSDFVAVAGATAPVMGPSSTAGAPAVTAVLSNCSRHPQWNIRTVDGQKIDLQKLLDASMQQNIPMMALHMHTSCAVSGRHMRIVNL